MLRFPLREVNPKKYWGYLQLLAWSLQSTFLWSGSRGSGSPHCYLGRPLVLALMIDGEGLCFLLIGSERQKARPDPGIALTPSIVASLDIRMSEAKILTRMIDLADLAFYP